MYVFRNNHLTSLIIALDGPAGSGKSTTARAVARRLGFRYLDTGAMYRAVALAFLRAGLAPTAEAARDVLAHLRLDVAYRGDEMRVLLDGEDVSEPIRTQAVGTMASRTSALAPVRQKMVEEQRRLARACEQECRGVVLDGRDIGTVVFPEADLKVFLVAGAEERARRRRRELQARGEDVPLEDVLAELRARDRKDRERAVAPLRKADDALELDTTRRAIDEQVQWVVDRVRERQRTSSG